jgi:hypothetical protein
VIVHDRTELTPADVLEVMQGLASETE